MSMQSFAYPSKWLAATLSPETLITSLSCGTEQFIGYSPQELVGRPITHILADPSVFDVPQVLATAKEWGYWEGEIVHRARGGKLLQARSTVSLLEGNGNRISGYLLISNLNKSLDLIECENLALTDVAANLRTLAHDLNNPLAVMMGFTQLLVLDGNCQGKIRNDIEKIYCELKRVIQVVERLHGYALSLYGKQKQDQGPDVTMQPA
jgi:PAS domain S-box-containing protein